MSSSVFAAAGRAAASARLRPVVRGPFVFFLPFRFRYVPGMVRSGAAIAPRLPIVRRAGWRALDRALGS